MNKIIIAGLIGQTGSGKSTVAAALREKDVPVIDGDLVAREVVQPGSEALKELCAEFGTKILNFDASLNRSELARLAFASKERTQRLNEITHPHITAKIHNEIEEYSLQGIKAVFVDAAALIESGFDKECDFLVCVTAPKELRLQRIMARDGLTQEMALLRMNAQQEEEFYTQRSEFVIKAYPPYDLEAELKPLFQRIGL